MTLLASVLLASLLGSVHCAAMCGAFVCSYVGQRTDTGGERGSHAAYHTGRLLSYTALGALAGWLGARVEHLGAMAGVNRAAAIAAGGLMVLWGGATIAASAGVRVPSPTPVWAQRALGSLLLRARDTRPAVRAAWIGLLTTLLPCGWLYAFVATAAATGRAGTGVAVMVAFWAGTVPMLMTVGFGARRVFGPFARRLPAVSAAVVMVLGMLAIAGRISAPGVHTGHGQPAVSAHAH